MNIDQSTEYIYVVFYDRRNTTGDVTDLCLARSTDGGDTFSNFKISEFSFFPVPWVFFGDYIHIAANDGKIHPIWARMDGNNLSVWTSVIEDSIFTAILKRNNFPAEFKLTQNFPNPFNSTTIIQFEIPHINFVQLNIYNVRGQFIKTLINQKMNPGPHSVYWNGTDELGNQVSSGIYVYTINSTGFQQANKMIFLK